MLKAQYPSPRQCLSKVKICVLFVIGAVFLAACPPSGFAQAAPKVAARTSWVFYGLLLDSAAGAPAHWDAGSPNFSIAGSKDPASPLLKPGMRIICRHAMNVRAADLVVGVDGEGNYQWGAKVGKSLQEGEQAEIVRVSPFHSKKGSYLWVEIKGQP
jgi:hypothetical protein